jgi:hypothetical protein
MCFQRGFFQISFTLLDRWSELDFARIVDNIKQHSSNHSSSSRMARTQSAASRRKCRRWLPGRGFSILIFVTASMVANIGFTWFAGTQLASHEQNSIARGSGLSHPGVARIIQGTVEQPQQNIPPPQRPRQHALPPQDSAVDTAGFIHIGKTAGSTISKLLRNGCTSWVTAKGPCRKNMTDETVVSKLVVRLVGICPSGCDLVNVSPHKYCLTERLPFVKQEHYYHVADFHRLPTANHKAFIISVRDVFDRTVSSLLYHHPKNAKAYNLKQTQAHEKYGPLAYSCFETVEAFAALINNGNSTECNYPYRHNVVDIENCEALACAVLHGKVRFFTHFFFNYQNILYTKLPSSPPRQLYVLRQEALWDDWKALNVMLGQTYPVVIPTSDFNQRNVSGISLPVTRDVSYEGRLKLCKALEMEYMAYFRILKSSINMEESDLESCRTIAQKNCPNLDTVSMLRHL